MTVINQGKNPILNERRPAHVPGGRDIWFFVLFESLVFTSYFCVYLFNRTQHEQVFLLGQSHLLLWLGVVDTIVLLSSSWAMAHCVQHARAGRLEDARRGAFLTGGFGLVFLILKIIEWVRLIHFGHTFTSSQFFQYYFFLTAIHCVHLLIGFVVIGVLVHRLSGRTRQSQIIVETCATYWHSVDFFWVMIFALLYVVR
jgi:nitric oxide reductase NorE protein